MSGDQTSIVHVPISEHVSFSLAYYRPGGRQPPHFHEFTQISFLLSGAMLETHGNRDWNPSGFAVGLKPAGISHANRWGDDGALIFSIRLSGGEIERTEVRGKPGWTSIDAALSAAELARTCVLSSSLETREDAMYDLLELLNSAPVAPGRPPAWLVLARDAIREEPARVSISEVARLAGVNRSHFSTVFRSYYQVAPSVFRRKVLVSRAISDLVCTDHSISRIAHGVGFADHAHLTRCVRTQTGIGPLALRKLLL